MTRVSRTVGLVAACVTAVALAQAQAPSGPAPQLAAAASAGDESSHYHGENHRLPTDDLLTGRRRFGPGAHTAWHIHPGGQLILVEEGVGVVQRRGEPLKVLHKGESDFTPAGVPHWHGAAPGSSAVMAMVHFGGIGPWLEPVSDEDYALRTAPLVGGATASAPRPAAAAASAGATYVGDTSGLPSEDMQVARGRFEAGARTSWHVHPTGQLILAEHGPVYVQHKGGKLKVLQTGESDFTPPGVAHWHAAGPDQAALKVVVNFGGATVWLDPVSDAEYAQAVATARK